MTKLLEEAVEKLSQLPEGRQDELALENLRVYITKDNPKAAWVACVSAILRMRSAAPGRTRSYAAKASGGEAGLEKLSAFVRGGRSLSAFDGEVAYCCLA